ncbi:MAG: Gfo/Idh/MocA family oxidoreductase [Bacteroidales bacterium]
MKSFALIGAAGYIAPKHLKAIKDTGNILVAALDKNDSVGILDSYFPHADFFVEFERFDRHLEKLRREGRGVDYVSICTPNYLHDAHIRFALRQHADAICEKPLVLNPWNAEALQVIEKETGQKVNTILQLRLHPVIRELKMAVDKNNSSFFDIELTYITSRGNWYFTSWKAQEEKSGGIATNIGIHFFDMLIWIFGSVEKNIVHVLEPKRAAGFLRLKNANVRWFLSIDENTLPDDVRNSGKRTYRSLTINGKELEFSEGFTDLHTLSYEKILKGEGFGIADAFPSIDLAHQIRNAKPVGLQDDFHPFALKEIEYHPFYKKKVNNA